jgi:hypothetical protein
MKRIEIFVGSKNAWITPRLWNSKQRQLRYAGISKKGHHDFALGSVYIVLQDSQLWYHRVEEGLWERAVIMLAMLERVCEGVGERETAGKGGSDKV